MRKIEFITRVLLSVTSFAIAVAVSAHISGTYSRQNLEKESTVALESAGVETILKSANATDILAQSAFGTDIEGNILQLAATGNKDESSKSDETKKAAKTKKTTKKSNKTKKSSEATTTKEVETTKAVVNTTTKSSTPSTPKTTTKKTNTTKKPTTKKTVTKESTTTKSSTTQKTSIGTFKVTGYCRCSQCCGKNTGVTASGKTATAGRTIAADTSKLPFGTKVVINGHTYVVEDRGGAIKGNRIDIFFDSHSEALKWGVKYCEVYIAE